ncbi:MAG: tetratricopeptide repeat protein [Candidatus Aminicenantes bacterium]|nr:tetratricopeptide repeat protein [Candidatus Aminicenantes bacterium]
MFNKKGNKQTEKTDPTHAKKRVLRFFISSTFRDMQEERDVLIRKVFPRLQQQFRWSGVELIPIDLRWGVTREQAENGAVLSICLEEIDQCQPYFIGLLGDRYGWIPDHIPPALVDAYPWLDKYRDRSLTEMEILHGVLNDTANQDRAFFFIREPLDSLAVSSSSSQDPNDEGPEEKAKLQALKERIYNSNCEFLEYKNADDLALQAYEILDSALSHDFPEQKLTDPFAQESQSHQVHALPFETIHVMREGLVQKLDDYRERGGSPFIVLGETGSGKTALMSNYYQHLKETCQDDFILLHFIGILEQNSIAGLIYRITGELKQHFDLDGALPKTDEQARSMFPRWLDEASQKGKVLLLIDDVDQLGYRNQQQNFSWIPAALPKNVRLIFTAKPENVPESLRSSLPNLLQLPLLSKLEREQIISTHFKIYGKKLEPRYVAALASAPQTALPLFLTIVLNELRVFGYFEKLDEHISHLLNSHHLLDLYHKVLERFEHDFCSRRPEIVKDFMSLIYYSRHGLTEENLQYSLKLDKTDTLFDWPGLIVASSGILKARHGRLFIGDKFLENAVWERYINNSGKSKYYHEVLAGCFTKQQMTAADMSELFWQLFNLQDWKQLHAIFADLDFIRSEIRSHVLFNEIMGYWLVMEKQSSFRIKATYKDVLENPNQDPELHEFITALVNDPRLRRLGAEFVNDLIKQPDPLFRNQYDPDPGVFIKKNKDGTSTVESVGSSQHSFISSFLQEMSEHSSLGMQAMQLYAKGDLDGAMETAKLQEELCRKQGDKSNLISSLIIQNSILKRQGELDAALVLLQEAEKLCLETNNRSKLSMVYGEQGISFLYKNQLDEALSLFQQQEKICRELENENSLQEAIRNQGLVMLARNSPDEALKLFQEQERICRKISNQPGLKFSLEKQAEIEFARRNWQKALDLYRHLEEICRKLTDQTGLQFALGRQGLIYFNNGNIEAAYQLWSAQEKMLRDLNDPNNMQVVLGNLGLIWEAKKNFPEAIKMYQEQERLCRQQQIPFGLQFSLDKQANLFYADKQYDKAAALWEEQEKIGRELNDMVKVQWAIGNQGRVYFDQNNPAAALSLFKEQERICRDLKDDNSLSISLFNQALTLQRLNEPEQALPLLEEAQQIFTRLNNTQMIERANQLLLVIKKAITERASSS